jgi:hypothetical protein
MKLCSDMETVHEDAVMCQSYFDSPHHAYDPRTDDVEEAYCGRAKSPHS